MLIRSPHWLVLLSGTLSGTLAGTPLAATEVAAPPAAQVDAIVTTAREKQGMPGVSVVVMRGDDVLLARGYGVEDASRKDAVTPSTIFAFNSISKQFVAALVLQLANEGKLSLDDPVARYLPEFTHLPAGLQIRHLLNHTSGMREDSSQPELQKLFDAPGTTLSQYVAAARHSPSDFAPGTRWSYSNINYLMLELIIEKVTGQALEEQTAARLFEPLQLHSIKLVPPRLGESAGEARGHMKKGDRLVAHPPENVSLFRGEGGHCGHALDLARWARALATGKVVSPAAYRDMTTRARLSDGRVAEYGFAMDLGVHDGVPRFGHGGYGGGFSAQMAYYPEAELTVVVLANRWGLPEYIERKIARRFLGLPEPEMREVALSAEERHRYAGNYDIGIHGSRVEITERGDRLSFELPHPKISFPLIYLGKGEFVSADDPDGYRLSFSGKEDALELRLVGMGMMTWYGERRRK